MTSTDTGAASPARQALDALTAPPHGSVGSIDNAAIRVVEQAERRGDNPVRTARNVVSTVEPLIVDDVVSRLLRGAKDTVTQWATRIHYNDGSEPSVGDPTAVRKSAELTAEGLNAAVADRGYRRRWSGHLNVVACSEVVTRQVVTLRDDSVFMSPWVAG